MALVGQEVDPAAYEHLSEPRIVERTDERVLEVRAVGDPDEVGGPAFGLLFQLYFSSGAATGFAPPAARARWQEGLDRIPRGEWTGRYALPLPETVDSLPPHSPPDGVTASIAMWEYGIVAEILHIGPYDAERPTIRTAEGLRRRRRVRDRRRTRGGTSSAQPSAGPGTRTSTARSSDTASVRLLPCALLPFLHPPLLQLPKGLCEFRAQLGELLAEIGAAL